MTTFQVPVPTALIEIQVNEKLQYKIIIYFSNPLIYKSTFHFQNVTLLELLSKYFTENKHDFIVNTDNIWCFCRMGQDEDYMIQFDNKICKIVWFIA